MRQFESNENSKLNSIPEGAVNRLWEGAYDWARRYPETSLTVGTIVTGWAAGALVGGVLLVGSGKARMLLKPAEELPLVRDLPKFGQIAHDFSEMKFVMGEKLKFVSQELGLLSDGQGPERLVTVNEMAGRYFIHDANATPAITSEGFRTFIPEVALGGKPYLVPFEQHGWSRLSSEARRAVDEAVPVGSKPIGVGERRQAWLTPKDEVVVIGPIESRQNCPFLLKAYKTQQIGNTQIEWFPYADHSGITRNDVARFERHMHRYGWLSDDHHIFNYGKTSDGLMWRLDPELLRKQFSLAEKSKERAAHARAGLLSELQE